MANSFFDHPILNSPYERPTRHWELDTAGEQVIGRALRRQSYELNDEGLFNAEYADIFGIPLDFTAKPVIAPPQPARD